MAENDPLRLDHAIVRRRFARAAGTYEAAAVLQREVGARLLERLEPIRLEPRSVLDLGCGPGGLTRNLLRRYPKARHVALELAPPMLRAARRRTPWLRRLHPVCGEAQALPFASDSFDLILSNLWLPWVEDLTRSTRELQRVLRPGGVLLFSSLGPDTLTELRAAWAQVDGYSHVHRFIDLHEVGDALVAARLADPVMDMEHITLTYRDVAGLMDDLRATGAANATAGRRRGLTTPRALRAMTAAYEAFRGADGRLPATWEVVYGHAWGTDAQPQIRGAEGEVRLPLSGLGIRHRRS